MEKSQSAFIRFIQSNRTWRHWSLAELARRSALTQPEISRLESGIRLPTLRHVKGLSEAFYSAPVTAEGQPRRYEEWITTMVELGERARINARCGPGRWIKRKVDPVVTDEEVSDVLEEILGEE